jgi:DNA-binding transcriptional LysR family regulator
MLGGIQRVLSPQHGFDAASATRVFRLAAPDFMLTLFADLLKALRKEAPGVAIEWTAPREPTLLDIAEGLIDAAVVPAELRWPPNVTGEAVGALGWRCFARKGHPAFRDWSRRTWAHWPHLAVRVGDAVTSPVNVAAEKVRLTRAIVGWVPNFCAIAPVLSGSDLLATLPALAMTEAAATYKLESAAVPFPIAPLPHALVWCGGRSRDSGLNWLLDRLRPIVKRHLAQAIRR